MSATAVTESPSTTIVHDARRRRFVLSAICAALLVQVLTTWSTARELGASGRFIHVSGDLHGWVWSALIVLVGGAELLRYAVELGRIPDHPYRRYAARIIAVSAIVAVLLLGPLQLLWVSAALDAGSTHPFVLGAVMTVGRG